jgi:hypothetical protein
MKKAMKAEAQSSFCDLRLELDCRTDSGEDPGVGNFHRDDHGMSQMPSHRSVSDADCVGMTNTLVNDSSCAGLRVSHMFSALRNGLSDCQPCGQPPAGPYSASLAMMPPPGQLFSSVKDSASGASSMPCRNMWGNADMLVLLKNKGRPSIGASLASKAAEAIGMLSLPTCCPCYLAEHVFDRCQPSV